MMKGRWLKPRSLGESVTLGQALVVCYVHGLGYLASPALLWPLLESDIDVK